MVRKTSIKAFREIRNSGLLSKRRWQVYRTLHRFGPATANELYDKMRTSKSKNAGNITTRLGELREMKCVDETGIRPCGITGKTCIVWDVNGKLPIPYEKPPTKDQRIRELRKRNRQLKKRLMLYE